MIVLVETLAVLVPLSIIRAAIIFFFLGSTDSDAGRSDDQFVSRSTTLIELLDGLA